MRTGSCQCGSVVFACAETPLALYACHCTECRKQSASAFGMSYQVPRASLRLCEGAPKVWQRVADSGNSVDCFFCPDCGSRLWHENSGSPETVTVKAGALDEPVDFSTAIHIWTASRLKGMNIPAGARSFEREPG